MIFHDQERKISVSRFYLRVDSLVKKNIFPFLNGKSELSLRFSRIIDYFCEIPLFLRLITPLPKSSLDLTLYSRRQESQSLYSRIPSKHEDWYEERVRQFFSGKALVFEDSNYTEAFRTNMKIFIFCCRVISMPMCCFIFFFFLLLTPNYLF